MWLARLLGRRRGQSGRGARLVLILAALGWAALGAVQAQTLTVRFTAGVYPAGWNLVSFGGATSMTEPGIRAALVPPLYDFQPGDTTYTTTDLQHLTPGHAYWAYLSHATPFFLGAGLSSARVSVPAGQCALVGNPSGRASAQVSGASRVLVYSALLQTYLSESLLGIGRGAWACNDAAQSTVISVANAGDVVGADWPSCCAPTPYPGNGDALLVFKNDSPAPLLLAARQSDANGLVLSNGGLVAASLSGCGACPEYTDHTSCSSEAVTQSLPVPPGSYGLHLQSDDHNVPDLLATIQVQANTTYVLCYYIDANRPQQALP
jgi:hypothetical protein